MADLTLNTGIQTHSEEIIWSSFREKNEDLTFTSLMKQALSKNYENKKYDEESFELNDYLEPFNNITEKKYKFKFTKTEAILDNEIDKNDKNKKNKKKVEKKKADLIIEKNKENDKKKKINDFVNSLTISKENMPAFNSKFIESFFSIVNWALHLRYQYKKFQKDSFTNKCIDISIYIDCATSLFRALKAHENILTEIIIGETFNLLIELENIIYLLNKSVKSMYDILNDNLLIIVESFWDKINPKSIQLYKEQIDTNKMVCENLDKKILIMVESPPGTGKTINSVILAKEIRERNKYMINENINYKKKILLYICYNEIVRTEVGKLCNSINIDVKFWIAFTKADRYDLKIKTFLRPFRNCYPDWNQKNMRSSKEDAKYKASKWKKFSENIHDQMEFFINETRRIAEQNNDLNDYLNADNLPEIIISDLESAYVLLKEFPDLFITFFDEAFASSSEDITAKIMSVMGHTLLVSATLPKPEEIPIVIDNFKIRHNCEDYSFLKVIRSTKQPISCTFVNSNGYIITPHDNIKDIESLIHFIPSLEIPLIRRSYSPEVLFIISKNIDSELPFELKFKNKFNYIGELNHESIRDYACEILTFIANSRNETLFNLLKSIKTSKITNMDINKIFAESAINYQNGNTLHVSIPGGFDNHVENISNNLLNGSPKIKNILNDYEKKINSLQSEIKSLEKNGNKDSEFEKIKLNQELSNIKYEWSNLFVMNTFAHANRFGNKSLLKNENMVLYPSKDELEQLDEIRSKLLFSNIGIYKPESFNGSEMDFFMKRINNFRFILSTPEIVYGTNIGLSIIDIDHKFLQYCTKNILYQLIGRAGRKGKSASALIIFRDDKMLDIIFQKSDRNIEAEQIEENFLKILNTK